ncbi:MAG: hypothetical protein EOO71_22740 [Myxococcaceae bacterium]|nr:MAG: hypothetical protein EOO71_22740 [Myxococcaceae bacterium]
MSTTMPRRERRKYTPEFKARAVKLALGEKEELAQLRREVRQLRMERERLKNAAARSTGQSNTLSTELIS